MKSNYNLILLVRLRSQRGGDGARQQARRFAWRPDVQQIACEFEAREQFPVRLVNEVRR